MFERYLGKDIRPLVLDAQERPAHYAAAQHAQIARLARGEDVPEADKHALLLQLVRRSEAQATERKVKKQLSAKLIAPEKDPPPFESQELFEGTIKLI